MTEPAKNCIDVNILIDKNSHRYAPFQFESFLNEHLRKTYPDRFESFLNEHLSTTYPEINFLIDVNADEEDDLEEDFEVIIYSNGKNVSDTATFVDLKYRLRAHLAELIEQFAKIEEKKPEKKPEKNCIEAAILIDINSHRCDPVRFESFLKEHFEQTYPELDFFIEVNFIMDAISEEDELEENFEVIIYDQNAKNVSDTATFVDLKYRLRAHLAELIEQFAKLEEKKEG